MTYLPYLPHEVQLVLDVATDWMLDTVFPPDSDQRWRVVSDPLEMLKEISAGDHGPQHAEQATTYYRDYLHCDTRRTTEG